MADNLTDVSVGADVKFPTHDISLTDVDGKQAGLVLCNRNGMKDPTQLRISAMPRTPMQMSQGSKGYDDMELPFVAEVQTTMSGGRGNETLSSDRTKFYDSYRIDTTKEYPICAPATIAQTGLIPAGNIELHTGSGYLECYPLGQATYLLKYAIAEQKIVTGISIDVMGNGKPFTIYYTPHTGANAPTFATYNLQANQLYSYFSDGHISPDEWTTIPLPIPAFTASTNFWVTLTVNMLSPGAIKIRKATTANGDIYNSEGQDWTVVQENAHLYSTISVIPEVDAKVFEYKRQLYAVLNATAKDSAKLFMNGWRGVADSNSTAMGKLIDATQTGWANNTAAGCIVLIINGAGEHEEQPWRRVVSSASGELVVSTPWKIAQGTTTEYVVLGSNVWTEIDSINETPTPDVNYLGQAVTSIAVVGNEVGGSYAVFAFGQGASDPVLSYYAAFQSAGALVEAWSQDTTAKADLLCPITDEQGKTKLWRADCDDCTVDYATLPATGRPTTLNFDINYETREDLKIMRARLVTDWDTEFDEGGDADQGVLASYVRQIKDLTYQITATATDTFGADSDYPGSGDQTVWDTYDGTYAVAHQYLPSNIKCGSTSSRITNLLPYGTPVQPYVMKEDSFGSIYNNIYQEIPLSELKSVRSEINGHTAMHYGVYLYFNLEGGRIERYYDQRIDDVGFNRDEGMPAERQGEVSKLLPYPGRFYASCDAGFSGYSTVMCNNGMGWHEIYRGAAGQKITDLYIQAIPGNEYTDRLWISQGVDLVAIPIAITPIQQYQYNFFGYGTGDYGYVETSWIDFELKDVNKYFHSITIFSDYTGDIKSHQEYNIFIWFKVDDEKSWTYVGNTQAYPNKELELRYPKSSTATHNVSGKKIKFKIAMNCYQQYETPRLKAIVVNGVLRMPVKQSWTATFLLEPQSDLRKKTMANKKYVNSFYDATLYKRLQYWANSKTHSTPLLMRTNDIVSDNKWVFLDPASIQTNNVQQIMGSGSGEKNYIHVATCQLYEV